jgi:hypothetical protein
MKCISCFIFVCISFFLAPLDQLQLHSFCLIQLIIKDNMTEPLPSTPQNILDLRDADFFAYIGRYCGEDILKYFELLGIRSIHSLMEIDDIFYFYHYKKIIWN